MRGGLESWSDPDKVIVVSALVLPFSIAWLWRSLHLLGDPTLSPYVDRAFLPTHVRFLWIQTIGHALLVGAAGFLRGRRARVPLLVHAEIQFWFLCASFTLYAVGMFTSPFGVQVLVLPVVGYQLFERRAMHLGLATLGCGILAGVLVPALGLGPYAPFMASAPFADGRLLTTWLLAMGLPSLFMVAVGIALHLHLLDRLRERQAALEEASRTDPLTALANRTEFFARLAEEIERARRHGPALSVLMADVDHFKAINDTFGHLAGDRVLRELGRRLRESLRSEDLGARYGGEEFAVVLPHTTLEEAELVAERLRAALQVAVGDDARRVTSISIGVARWDGSEDADALVARADEALYVSKQEGRDRVSISRPPPMPPPPE